ncbi:tetratricopeptide repeat protein [bacterium]|nr:tetratricopeptide repeat protein [bacterium]
MHSSRLKISVTLVGFITMCLLLFMADLAVSQNKSHSAVIGGVKVRFKNAVSQPADAQKYYEESIDLLLKNNVVRDEREKDKEETYFYLGSVYYYMREYKLAYDAFQNSLSHGKKFLEKGEHITGGIELFSIKECINDMKLKTFNQGNKAFNTALTMSAGDSSRTLYYQAIDKYNLILAWDPQSVINGTSYAATVYNLLANSYIQLMNSEKDEANKKILREKVLENLLKLSDADKSNLTVMYNIFIQYYDEKNYDKSIEWINKALTVETNDSLAKVIKSTLVQQKAYIYDNILGKTDEAFKTYEELIKSDPNNPDWHFNLARLYFGKNQNDKAIEELKIVKRLKPSDEESNFQVADEMFFAYQKQRSSEIEKHGGVAKADMKIVTEILKPDIEACKKNIMEAIDVMGKNLETSSDRAESHYRIGKFYNLLAELEGNLAYNLENKEKVKLQKPYFEKAVNSLKETIKINPTHKNAWQNLFVAYTNLQLVKERDEALKKFNELGK